MDCNEFGPCSSKTVTSELNTTKNFKRAEVKEAEVKNDIAATDHGEKVAPKEFNEYPVFNYRPFMFHLIESLIKEKIKAMDYVKTVGLCCGDESSDDLYLEEIAQPGQASDKVPARICLRFYCTDAVPKVGANVEAFGCVQYESSEGENIPVLQVWFFRICCGNVASYIETLLQVRQVLDK